MSEIHYTPPSIPKPTPLRLGNVTKWSFRVPRKAGRPAAGRSRGEGGRPMSPNQETWSKELRVGAGGPWTAGQETVVLQAS